MKPDRSPIDWTQVRARLEASRAALESSLVVSPERLESVYRERAAALAARQGQIAAPLGRRVLVFELGAGQYALNFNDVAGVLPFDGCTPVPGGPPGLLGVLNVRGDVRSVVDLRLLLSLPVSGADESGYVLLLRYSGREVCLRVGKIDWIRALVPGEQLAQGVGDTTPFTYLAGVTPDGLKLLDTAAILGHAIFQPSALLAQQSIHSPESSPHPPTPSPRG